MQLKDNFFRILSQKCVTETTEYRIRLNAAHAIYTEHFPGNPVTPGVCMIQIIKELVAEKLSSAVCLTTVSRVRYFRVISPVETPEVNLSIELTAEAEEAWKVSAFFSEGETKFAQFSLLFERPK